MEDLPTGLRTLTLGSSDLRTLAFRSVNLTDSAKRLTDLQVLGALLNRPIEPKHESLERLAIEVGKAYGRPFNLGRDIETDDDGKRHISEHFWRKLVARLKNRPWAFICLYAENDASAIHRDVHGITYGFHEDVTTWQGIVAADSDAYILFYNTVNAPVHKKHFTAIARISSIEVTYEAEYRSRRQWRANLEDFCSISPVPVDAVEIEGRNRQHGIQAVTWETLVKVVQLGNGTIPHWEPNEPESVENVPSEGPRLEIGDVLAHAPKVFEFVRTPASTGPMPLEGYQSSDENDPQSNSFNSRKSDRDLDKATEQMAVHIATRYLAASGWTLVSDCQRAGVGYDFEFERLGQQLLVEVKGIRGSKLSFNMTAKEWHVLETRENFVLIAVVNVLDSSKYGIRILQKEQLFSMRRRATQFRISD